MSMVLTRRPPTIACRRFGDVAPFCCALIRLPSRLHPANITPPAAAAFLRKSLRLVMNTLHSEVYQPAHCGGWGRALPSPLRAARPEPLGRSPESAALAGLVRCTLRTPHWQWPRQWGPSLVLRRPLTERRAGP